MGITAQFGLILGSRTVFTVHPLVKYLVTKTPQDSRLCFGQIKIRDILLPLDFAWFFNCHTCDSIMLHAWHYTVVLLALFCVQGGAKNGAILSHCKYSENSMTEFRGNWWTSAIVYAEQIVNCLFKNFIALWRHLAKTTTVWCSNLFVQCE